MKLITIVLLAAALSGNAADIIVDGVARPQTASEEAAQHAAWLVVESQMPDPNAPRVEPNGIETPVIVLQSQTNDWGVAVVAADDGALVTYYDHQSPRPDEATRKARRDAALAAHYADKAATKALLAALGKDSKLDKATKDAATNAAAASAKSADAGKPKAK